MASGPSMCAEDAELVRKWRDGKTRFAAAINTTYRLAPWADLIYACDLRWWDEYFEDVNRRRTEATLVGHNEMALKKYPLEPSGVPETHTGGNSGCMLIHHLMHQRQASRLILLGYDMGAGGDGHWHGKHPHGWPEPVNFKAWREHIRRVAAERPEVEIINCTRETALTCFPQMPLEDALNADVCRSAVR